MTEMLQARIDDQRPSGEAVLAALRAEAARLGLELPLPVWDEGKFSLQRDPFSGEESLVARWRDGPRGGRLDLRPDGGLYAEFDILARHPRRPGWFVEAVVAWGKASSLKCEPRLLPLPE
jgi:hypothetical protein